jgi:hypothetical protein
MEKYLEPVELSDDELGAVAGGYFNNAFNNFANVTNSGNNSVASGTNSNSHGITFA